MLPMLLRDENIHAGVRVARSASPAHAGLGDYPSGRGMTWRLAGNQGLDDECDGIMVSRSWMQEDVGKDMGGGNRGLREDQSVMRCKVSRSRCAPRVAWSCSSGVRPGMP